MYFFVLERFYQPNMSVVKNIFYCIKSFKRISCCNNSITIISTFRPIIVCMHVWNHWVYASPILAVFIPEMMRSRHFKRSSIDIVIYPGINPGGQAINAPLHFWKNPVAVLLDHFFCIRYGECYGKSSWNQI